ncbi:hypothetical protein E4L73_08275 [Burkholderia pseudomallei]|nr:hypothetical protein [Burkholderia pseudomallei]MPT68465.1 hypothetical protein [Burkholderia pseudomallei]MPT83593.1 hypothetical protein [Burkholderia pseudomallei]MPT96955.1 hypothetical protein [Burkholderia pseudomallei]
MNVRRPAAFEPPADDVPTHGFGALPAQAARTVETLGAWAFDPGTAHRSPLTAHRSPLTAHRSPLTAHRSPLTAHRSPLTAHRSPLTASASKRPPPSRPCRPRPATAAACLQATAICPN